MGRKRKNFGEQRQPISISLPRNLIMDLDRTLDDEHSRSKVFERLLKKHLSVNTKLSDFQRHAYECLTCGRTWHQSRFDEIQFKICGGSSGCGNMKIRYLGIYKEDEEE